MSDTPGIRSGYVGLWLPVVLVCVVMPTPRAVADSPTSAPSSQPANRPELISVARIWDEGKHNAFTDLVRFDNRWLCTFREGIAHMKGNGKLRVIFSPDGQTWTSVALLAEDGVDLRDPKLTVMPDGRLLLLGGGSIYKDGKRVTFQPRVAFSPDGRTWTPTRKVLNDGEWLWRLTWHEGRAYGVSYRAIDPGKDWTAALYSTADGLEYERITVLDVPNQPNETTLRFLPDGTMIALVRREAGNRRAWIGTSRKPYTQWAWKETEHQIGGPNFIILPDGAMWAAGRSYPGEIKTVLARFGLDGYEPVLALPSRTDTSYPGLVWHDGLLWMSYYSSHEGKTSIYLARVRLPTDAATSAPASISPR